MNDCVHPPAPGLPLARKWGVTGRYREEGPRQGCETGELGRDKSQDQGPSRRDLPLKSCVH